LQLVDVIGSRRAVSILDVDSVECDSGRIELRDRDGHVYPLIRGDRTEHDQRKRRLRVVLEPDGNLEPGGRREYLEIDRLVARGIDRLGGGPRATVEAERAPTRLVDADRSRPRKHGRRVRE